MTSPLDILAARSTEFDLSADKARPAIVYCLVDNGEIVYVGQTVNIEQRIALHLNKNLKREEPKAFDRAFWFEVPAADLDVYEHALIRALRPRYNQRAGVHLGRDNEVLAALGLPLLDDEYENAKAFRSLKSRRNATVRTQSKVIECVSAALERVNINDSELARRVGVSTAAVSLWMTGQCVPSVRTLHKIASALECDISDLMTALAEDRREMARAA